MSEPIKGELYWVIPMPGGGVHVARHSLRSATEMPIRFDEAVVGHLCESVVSLRAQLAATQSALNKYGHHFQGCSAQWQDTAPCECGYEAAMSMTTVPTPPEKREV